MFLKLLGKYFQRLSQRLIYRESTQTAYTTRISIKWHDQSCFRNKNILSFNS